MTQESLDPWDVILDGGSEQDQLTLATAGTAEHRYALAGAARALPASVVSVLVKDRDPLVRSALADRLDLPDELHSQLMADPDSMVRRHAARADSMRPRSCGSRAERGGGA